MSFPLLSRNVSRLQTLIGYSRPPGPDAFPMQGVFRFTELLFFPSLMKQSGLGALPR